MPDQEPKSDCVNDLGGAIEPSFTHVAICTGVDVDSCPVTLVDRLCMNRPAVDIVNASVAACEQDKAKWRNESIQQSVQLANHERDLKVAIGGAAIGGTFVLFLLFLYMAFKRS